MYNSLWPNRCAVWLTPGLQPWKLKSLPLYTNDLSRSKACWVFSTQTRGLEALLWWKIKTGEGETATSGRRSSRAPLDASAAAWFRKGVDVWSCLTAGALVSLYKARFSHQNRALDEVWSGSAASLVAVLSDCVRKMIRSRDGDSFLVTRESKTWKGHGFDPQHTHITQTLHYFFFAPHLNLGVKNKEKRCFFFNWNLFVSELRHQTGLASDFSQT